MTDARLVVLVTADAGLHRLLRAYLEARSYDVRWVREGRRAAAVVSVQRPALTVVDLDLPDEDGPAVAGQVRAMTIDPLLLLVAGDTANNDALVRAIGAEAYLAKPFTAEALFDAVTYWAG